MGIAERKHMYSELEEHRGRPLIVYCTSTRPNAVGNMANDAIYEIQQQLLRLPKRAKSLDLLIASTGGDPNVAWRIVSLIREQVDHLEVLVPNSAHSAATMIALGANKIVMHPFGNLGPTDPQITAKLKREDGDESFTIGSEDMASYFAFARDELGITDQGHLTALFQSFASAVTPSFVGTVVRSSKLSVAMGEKLLQLHMSDQDQNRAREISEELNRKYFHHGYPLSRSEAKEIGLPIAKSDKVTEELMWSIWCDIAAEMKLNEPFSPLTLFDTDAHKSALFSHSVVASIPAGLPEELREGVYKSILSQVTITELPAVDYSLVHAVAESKRRAARFISRGKGFVRRDANYSVNCKLTQITAKWEQVPIPRI